MNEALLGWLALFVVMSGFIVAAGVLLARSGDSIANRTGLGGLLIGMVLVAAATSLPEIAVAVSAVVEGSPDLAIGNLLGSNMANMALLALVDLAWRGGVWHRVDNAHGRSAAVGIALTAVVVLAIIEPFGVDIGWVGIESIVIVVAFIALIAWTRRSRSTEVPPDCQVDDPAARPMAAPTDRSALLRELRPDLLKFGLTAVVILVSAPILVIAAEGIATESNLGDTFVGASFLAFATSLPELATAVAALRIGAFELAVGSLLGSNAFNMAIVFLVDLAYFDGPILADVAPIEAFVGTGAILLMSIVLASLVHGARTRITRLEPGSLMTIIVYLLLMFVIWNASS